MPLILITIVVMCSSLWPSSNSLAVPLRCEDSEGNSVLTDSPAQLQNCKPIDLKKKTEGFKLPLNKKAFQPPPRKKAPIRRPPRRRPQPAQQQAPPQLSEQKTKAEQPDKELPIAVPLTKIGGSLVVQVLLNGTQSAHLIVDTGATMTVLSYDLGIELGLLSGSGVDISTVNTAGGSVQVNITKIGQIQVGQAKVDNVQVAIHDLPGGISGVSGLLGMSFLKHFTVTLDSNRGFLYLAPRSN
ncbi:MAG: retropepsin-like aspartic protease [Nitrospirota bacterium]|nr:retropepsin-like aspartic protease [Nitrospirota bacterium]